MNKSLKNNNLLREYCIVLYLRYIDLFKYCFSFCVFLKVPDTSQILEGSSQSSTSITIKWSAVPSAQSYILEVYSQTTGKLINFTFTTTTTVVQNLQPSTNYDCYITTVNQAGMGSRSKVRTITTCE